MSVLHILDDTGNVLITALNFKKIKITYNVINQIYFLALQTKFLFSYNSLNPPLKSFVPTKVKEVAFKLINAISPCNEFLHNFFMNLSLIIINEIITLFHSNIIFSTEWLLRHKHNRHSACWFNIQINI